MDICDKLIDLRIALTTACDGFSKESGNKNSLLSSKIKVLHLLADRDMMPVELITSLGVAKSNLANLSKQLIDEGLVESYKTFDNLRNVYYRITKNGRQELQSYKCSLEKLFCCKFEREIPELEICIDKILSILKKD